MHMDNNIQYIYNLFQMLILLIHILNNIQKQVRLSPLKKIILYKKDFKMYT